MKVLRNHFNGNSTVIIDGRIINGCQNFTMEEAPAVLLKHKVPKHIWQQVLDIYTHETDSNESVAEFTKDSQWYVRLIVTKQGYGLDVLINDPVRSVRIEVAKQGYGLDVLVNDPDWEVRAVVAQHGYGLDILVNDPSWLVREAAKHAMML